MTKLSKRQQASYPNTQRCVRKSGPGEYSTTRPDVLSLAEYTALQTDATTQNKYTATLPFDPNVVPSWRFTASVVELTRAGWDWFEYAQASWPGLGTFGFLPQEIRDHILNIVIDTHSAALSFEDYCRHNYLCRQGIRNCPYCDCLDGMRKNQLYYQPDQATLFRPDAHKNPDVFDFGSYSLISWDRVRMSMPFRLASQGFRAEIDRRFLARHTFKFDCPKAFTHFLDAIAHFYGRRRRKPLRNLIIEIFGHCGCCEESPKYQDWMDVCGAPPCNLEYVKSVRFEIGAKAHSMPFGGRAGYWDDSYEAWVGGNPTKVDQINKVTELLEVVTKQLARFAPRAGISMLEDTYFLDEDNMVLGDGLCELEHMSIPAEKTSLEIEYVTLVDESYFFEKKEEEEYDMVDDEYFELVAKKKIRKHRYGG